ncbi:MAG: hypothetical protein H0U62_06145 [Actinobacteria bacterium]|jgi:D-aminopeptidase|nr:hypothetical protein [Actinomycetota bacterium]
MPLFVVKDQANLEELSRAVLRARPSRVVREAAAAAIRAANPTIDLDHLWPGTVLVIPTLEGARTNEADPTGAPAEEMRAAVGELLVALAAGHDQAAAEAEREREAALSVISSAEVRRLADSSPELRAAVDSWRETAKLDAATTKRQTAALKEAVEIWNQQLNELGRTL